MDTKSFELLGVEPTATPEEIRAAFKSRVKVLHPDRFDRASQPVEWEMANQMLTQLNAAYASLKVAVEGPLPISPEAKGPPPFPDLACRLSVDRSHSPLVPGPVLAALFRLPGTMLPLAARSENFQRFASMTAAKVIDYPHRAPDITRALR